MTRGWRTGLLQLLLSAAAGAAVFLLSIPEDRRPEWSAVLESPALVAMALTAMFQLYAGFHSLPLRATRRHKDIDEALRSLLIEMPKVQAVSSPHYYLLSAHVWEVSPLYRLLFPYPLRQVLKRWYERLTGQHYKGHPAWRWRLKLVGFRTERDLEPTGIRFRKGNGLVGIALNQRGHLAAKDIDYEVGFYKELQESGDRDRWEKLAGEEPDYTLGLDYDTFLVMAERYGQAVAVPVSGRKGEAIGVLTLEAAPGYDDSIVSNDLVRETMAITAKALGSLLRRRILPDR